MNKFTVPQESIAGLPTIMFEFDGSLGRAELAGAKLTADTNDDHDRANLCITDAQGNLLVDIMVRRAPVDENIAVSVVRVGSALLWSHARYVEVMSAVVL